MFRGALFAGKLFQGLLFGVSETVEAIRVGGDDAWKKARKKYERRKREFDDALERTLRNVYARLRGDVPAKVLEIVKPLAKPHDTAAPPTEAVDWRRIAQDEFLTIDYWLAIGIGKPIIKEVDARLNDDEEALLLLIG